MIDIVTTYQNARRDPDLVVLEGFHALKHAVRFGAEISFAITTDLDMLDQLAVQLAPDVRDRLRQLVQPVERNLFQMIGNNLPRVEVLAIARRPKVDGLSLLTTDVPRPVILLEEPHNLGNVGAAVRVAAAAGAAGVVTTGHIDPWNSMVVRGAAGLHFAVPVAKVSHIPDTVRPVVALHPDGENLSEVTVPSNAILVFGTERHGLSAGLLERADLRIRIPMKPMVSSLNLATSVAIMLYRL